MYPPPATILLGLALPFLTVNELSAAPSPLQASGDPKGLVTSPLAPDYLIESDGSVVQRICFNWSCSRQERHRFTPADVARIKERMAACSGTTLYDRLQRVRIGIWQMELLAENYQPLLANDLAINEGEKATAGRMDCVDNSTNTTTYLHVLKDLGALPGWTVEPPRVRKRFDLNAVHWTAVISDDQTATRWSVDSWYRPNGHLPMVMPLKSWLSEKTGWEGPYAALNPTPQAIHEMCRGQTIAPALLEDAAVATPDTDRAKRLRRR